MRARIFVCSVLTLEGVMSGEVCNWIYSHVLDYEQFVDVGL